MTGCLLDTNLSSELIPQKPATRIERWLDEVNDEELDFSVVSLGEIPESVQAKCSSAACDKLSDLGARI